MKIVMLTGIISAEVVWLMAFFNVNISPRGNEERTFNEKFFMVATGIATAITMVVFYAQAAADAVETFDAHLMPYESGMWSLVGTVIFFMGSAGMYAMAVYSFSEWIQNHKEAYLYGIIERVEVRVRRELEIKYDQQYGDELADLRDLAETYGLNVPDAPNPETVAFLKEHDEKVEAERAAAEKEAKEEAKKPEEEDDTIILFKKAE